MDKKICFVASSGGHLEEISRLKAIEQKYDSFLITEKSDFTVNNFCDKKYFVFQINRREILFIPKLIILFFKAFIILRRENPDVIITTGALVCYPFCMVGRIFKKKIVYIESFARVTSASLTGKLLYKHSDLFIVQWEDALKHFPNATVGGGLF